jgi:hypothetical protein
MEFRGEPVMSSVLIASANIFFSLLLGAVALVFVGIQYPELFSHILDGAGWVRDEITGTALNVKYNNWIRFLIDEKQITYMFFTVVCRIALALVVAGGRAIMSRT